MLLAVDMLDEEAVATDDDATVEDDEDAADEPAPLDVDAAADDPAVFPVEALPPLVAPVEEAVADVEIPDDEAAEPTLEDEEDTSDDDDPVVAPALLALPENGAQAPSTQRSAAAQSAWLLQVRTQLPPVEGR